MIATRRALLSRLARFGLLGSLLLTGCPGAGDVGGSTVAGIQTNSPLSVQTTSTTSNNCQTPSNSDALVARVLELVNKERTQRGLNALTLNPILSKMAEDYACRMIQDGFFAHTYTDPVTNTQKGPFERAIDAGYVFLVIGENLAGGQTTPEQVMAEWMASTQGHRENILRSDWKEIGIGVRAGGEYGVYWVQEFGNPP